MSTEPSILPKKDFVNKPTVNKRISYASYVLCVAIVSFLVLAFLAKNTLYFPFDLVITRSIQQYNPFWFDFLMKSLTNIGFTIPAILTMGLFVGILFLLKRKRESLFTLLSTGGLVILGTLVKLFVARPRPSPTLIHQIETFTRPNSFPSGHVLFYVGLYGFLFIIAYSELRSSFLRTLLLLFFGMMVVLIGVSRIYVGAHWFSDVIGAYLLGFIWLVAIMHFYKKAIN